MSKPRLDIYPYLLTPIPKIGQNTTLSPLLNLHSPILKVQFGHSSVPLGANTPTNPDNTNHVQPGITDQAVLQTMQASPTPAVKSHLPEASLERELSVEEHTKALKDQLKYRQA